jgi:hypothetical protein
MKIVFEFVVDNFKSNMVRQLSAVLAQKKAALDDRNAKAAKLANNGMLFHFNLTNLL